jgi:flavin-binding protein dodecin
MYHLLGTGHKSVDEGVKEAIALWEETLEVRQVVL